MMPPWKTTSPAPEDTTVLLGQATEPRLRITLERGQRGTYAWSLAMDGPSIDPARILNTLARVDRDLRETYLVEVP